MEFELIIIIIIIIIIIDTFPKTISFSYWLFMFLCSLF